MALVAACLGMAGGALRSAEGGFKSVVGRPGGSNVILGLGRLAQVAAGAFERSRGTQVTALTFGHRRDSRRCCDQIAMTGLAFNPPPNVGLVGESLITA